MAVDAQLNVFGSTDLCHPNLVPNWLALSQLM